MNRFNISVPCSTSNIGPGFDCVGMALTLRNETWFDCTSETLTIQVEGFGSNRPFPASENLIVRTFLQTIRALGGSPPAGVNLTCKNRIPMGSGLGSSSTAIVTGILAADAWLNRGLSQSELLNLAANLEGHPDNVTPALMGGLVAANLCDKTVTVTSFPTANWNIAVVVPRIAVSTKEARAALPKMVPLTDAVFNLSHVVFLIKALQTGDEAMLRYAMQDRLHENYRIALMPGLERIKQAAQDTGAIAGISGAGPGMIAFRMGDVRPACQAMECAARESGLKTDAFLLHIDPEAAFVREIE